MALLKVGQQGGLYYHKVYTRPLTWLEYTHVFFLKGAKSNTLDICFLYILSHVWSGQYIEGFTPFLRVPLIVKYLQCFWMGFQYGVVKLWSFPRDMACLIHQYSCRSLILLPGCCFSAAIVWRFVMIFCLLFPCVQGDTKLLARTAPLL